MEVGWPELSAAYCAAVAAAMICTGYLWGPEYIDEEDGMWIFWACLFWPLSMLIAFAAITTRALTSFGQYLAGLEATDAREDK